MTVELPDSIARMGEKKAAALGIPVSQLVAEMVETGLGQHRAARSGNLMAGFGELQHLHEDLRMIEREVEEAFEHIEPEDGE